MARAAYDAYDTWSKLDRKVRKRHVRMTDEIMNVLVRYDAADPNALPPLSELLEIIGNELRKLQHDLVRNARVAGLSWARTEWCH
jgi:hypothetical protein